MTVERVLPQRLQLVGELATRAIVNDDVTPT